MNEFTQLYEEVLPAYSFGGWRSKDLQGLMKDLLDLFNSWWRTMMRVYV